MSGCPPPTPYLPSSATQNRPVPSSQGRKARHRALSTAVSFPQTIEHSLPVSPSRLPALPPPRVLDWSFSPYLTPGGEPASAPEPRSGGDTTACFCPGGLRKQMWPPLPQKLAECSWQGETEPMSREGLGKTEFSKTKDRCYSQQAHKLHSEPQERP